MSIAIIIIILASILIFLIVLSVLFYKLYKFVGPDVPPNSPLIFSLDPNRTGGYAFSVLKETKLSSKTSSLIVAKPLDLGYNSRGKPIPHNDIDFTIRNEKKIELPPGTLSLNRSCVILLPENASNLNDEFRNTELGTAISSLIELRNYKDKAIDIIANRQAGERTYLALLEEEQNKLISFYKGQITEITAHAKEKAIVGGIR